MVVGTKYCKYQYNVEVKVGEHKCPANGAQQHLLTFQYLGCLLFIILHHRYAPPWAAEVVVWHDGNHEGRTVQLYMDTRNANTQKGREILGFLSYSIYCKEGVWIKGHIMYFGHVNGL